MDIGNQHIYDRSRIRHLLSGIIVVTFFWIVFFLMADPMSAEKVGSLSFRNSIMDESAGMGVGPVFSQDTEISQSFVSSNKGLKGVEFYFATYGRNNNSSFLITIVDSDGRIVYQNEIDASTLQDNVYFGATFEEEADSKGREYTAVIKGIDGNKDNSPTIWIYAPNNQPAAVVNGEEMDYSLGVRLVYNSSLGVILYRLVVALMMLGSYIAVVFGHKTDERGYLLLCILLGVLFVFINPFYHAMDELSHYLKSYSISGFAFSEKIVKDHPGFMVPSNLDVLLQSQFFGLTRNVDLMGTSLNTELHFYTNPYTATIIPINHVVAALGLMAARLLHLNLGLTVWCGRLANYAFYVFASYYAIKNARYYKSLFFVVATTPAILWMAGSYSTDPVLIATSLLFVSICLKYRFSDEPVQISTRDMILIMCCGACIASVKYFIYLPILTCFYLIPKDCFRKKQRMGMIAGAICVVILLAVWQYCLMKKYAIADDRNLNASISGQIGFMFGNIVFTIKNFVNFILTNLASYGGNGFYNSIFPAVSSMLCILCLLSAVISNDKYPLEKMPGARAIRIHFIAIFVVVSLMIMGALYVGYTTVGAFRIDGVQPRYFQPVLIFLMLPLAMTNIRNDNKYHEKWLFLAVECNLLLALTGLLMDTFH